MTTTLRLSLQTDSATQEMPTRLNGPIVQEPFSPATRSSRTGSGGSSTSSGSSSSANTRSDDAIAGFVNLNVITRGALMSCAAGWAAFLPHAGAGHMTQGLGLALEISFTQLGLHRVEANIQPGNVRSRDLAVAIDPARALQPVDAVSGALMLLPRSLFERIGGFDEGYRLHAEDLDLCRRARQAGALVAVANDVQVVHLRGVSSRSRPLFVEWHKHRGLWRYFRRFDAARTPWHARAAVWCATWLRFPFAVLRQWRR